MLVITLPRLQCQPKGTQQLRVRMLVITLPTFTAPTQLYKSRLRQNREEVNQNPGYSESRLQIRAAGCGCGPRESPVRIQAANPESRLQIRAAGCGLRAEGEPSQNPGCKSGLRAAGCGVLQPAETASEV